MNYYEELGVSPHASGEEIKEAYRLLVRLLHPDHHTDPALQRVAEQKMKDLNRVYATLMDGERRRRYDSELAAPPEREIPIIVHAPPVRRTGWNSSSMAWVAAVASFAVLLIWMASREVPGGPSDRHDAASNGGEGALPMETGARPVPQLPGRKPVEKQAEPAVVKPVEKPIEKADPRPPAEIAALRTELQRAVNERDSARADAARLALRPLRAAKEPEAKHAKPAFEPIPQQAPLPAPPQIVARVTAPPVAALQNAANESHPPILGVWVYRKANTPAKNKELYPPEFIETTITGENGQVRGQYRARYQVPDRPVSPDVNFQFAGKFSGDSGSLPWSGSGGSKGQVILKIMSDHSLRVDWVASQLGSLGFYKGTAVLVKRAD